MMLNDNLSIPKRLCIVLSLIQSAPNDEPISKITLRQLADELVDHVSSIQLQVIMATSSSLLAAGFPNLTHETVSQYIDSMDC
tara:strand:+ start:1421 stop:1669 length:249 start_codon:yes stop_codon:yes gene_type:complete